MSEISTSAGTSPRWPQAWRDYLEFVRRPVLPSTIAPMDAQSLNSVAMLGALNLLIAGALLTIYWVVDKLWVHLPEPDLHLDMPLIQVLAITGIPILEETVFRSWLTGRPIMIMAAVAAIMFILAFPAAAQFGLVGVIGALLLWLVSAMVLFLPKDWLSQFLRKHFQAAFWISTLLFAGAHLTNYLNDLQPLILFLIVPQLISGSIFGYARVRYGMWSNITLHASLNAAVLILATVSG